MNRFSCFKKYFFTSIIFFASTSISFALNVSKCELVGAYMGTCCNVQKIEKLSRKGINAVVIDVKDDNGKILLDLDNGGEKISEFIKKLKEKNFYTIARIVAFKDKKKVRENKSWAICNKDGSIFFDKEKMCWLNPYNEEVQDYLINLAKLAIQYGFDEVQYDYIRFSAYKTVDRTQISQNFSDKSKIEIISEFLEKAAETIHEEGGKISADVFGCVIPNLFYGWENNSEILGQDYEQIVNLVDFICPMIYPSHFPLGFVTMREIVTKEGKTRKISFSAPDLFPYEIIRESLLASNKSEIEKTKVRPWLQCFSASWLKPGKWKRYTAMDIQKQINATTDREIFQCCLWNPAANYSILG